MTEQQLKQKITDMQQELLDRRKGCQGCGREFFATRMKQMFCDRWCQNRTAAYRSRHPGEDLKKIDTYVTVRQKINTVLGEHGPLNRSVIAHFVGVSVYTVGTILTSYKDIDFINPDRGIWALKTPPLPPTERQPLPEPKGRLSVSLSACLSHP